MAQSKLRNIPGISRKDWNSFQNLQKSSKMVYNSPVFTQQYIEQLIHENSPHSSNIFKLPQAEKESAPSTTASEMTSSSDTDHNVQNGVQNGAAPSQETSSNCDTEQEVGADHSDDGLDGHDGNDDESESQQIEEMNFIYEHFRIILREFVDFFLWMSKIIDAEPEKFAKMKFELNGEEISFFRAGVTPTELVSVADYMMYTWNDAVRSTTKIEHRMSIDDKIVKSLKDHCRRLYRLLAYAYFVHEKEFETFERRHHLALKFTLYVRTFKMMKKKDLWMPKSRLQKWKNG